MNLRTVWAGLERQAEKVTPASTISKRISATMSADLFVAITPARRKALLLQIPKAPKIGSPFSAKGLQLSSVALPGATGDSFFWQLELGHPAYFDLFIAVVEDVASALSGIKEEASIPRLFLQRLAIWQEFLSKYGPSGLSENEEQGLVGELWHLKERMLRALNAQDALNAWKGPEKLPRDFQHMDAAIEVKTTTGKRHVTIRIANENQLDDAGLKLLALCHIEMAQVQSSGVSLPELVVSLREIFTKAGQSLEFDRKVRHAGYLDAQADLYRQNRYRIVSETYFHVKDGFPRILSKDVPTGVGDVIFSIAVSSLGKFKISSDAVFAHFK